MMRKELRGVALLFAAVLYAYGPTGARGDAITQEASIPLTTTNFDSGTPVLAGVDPLSLFKFDSMQGTRVLDSVTIALSSMTHNEFEMNFITGGTIKDTVISGDPSAPVPTITIFEPDGVTPALVLKASSDPSLFTRTVTYGLNSGQTLPQEFSSALPATSPFYLAPTTTSASTSATITLPTQLAQFIGTGPLALPVTAAARNLITVSSGNGGGKITTTGSADVTVSYNYHIPPPVPQTIPEPATIALWGLVGAGMLAVGRRRGRKLAA